MADKVGRVAFGPEVSAHERLMDRLHEVADRKRQLEGVRAQFIDLIKATDDVKELKVLACYLAMNTHLADWEVFKHWLESEDANG